MVARDFITQARMHQRIAAYQRLPRCVMVAQILRRLVTHEFESGLIVRAGCLHESDPRARQSARPRAAARSRCRRTRASSPARLARRQPRREPVHLGTAPQGIGSEVAVCRDGCHYSSAISAMASKRALIRASSATRFARSAGSSVITITPSKKASTGACNCASRESAPA